MRPPAPYETAESSRHRAERQRQLASTPGTYGLERLEVRAVEGPGFLLRLHFLAHDAGQGEDIPPELGPDGLAVWDDDGRPVPVEVRSLERAGDAPRAMDAAFVLERGSIAELRHQLLTLVLTGPEMDPFFAHAHFQLTLERDLPPASGSLVGRTPALPPSSYQAKDYESFTRLLLDRMRLTVPAWKERHAADMGVMLVELLAHAGDALSYYQDAVSAEAYLGTARRRASLKRHARLLDYTVHEGCNARVWVHVRLPDTTPHLELPAGTAFDTAPRDAPRGPWDVVPADHHATFESLQDARLLVEHNAFTPYTWGAARAELPQGSTSLTLLGGYPKLARGDVLVLEELLHPVTERSEEADPRHRHAVRLNAPPVLEKDPLTGQALTRVSWFPEDALPFPLALGTSRGGLPLSQVLGNLVLADHGATQPEVEVEVDDEGTARLPLGGARVVSSERYAEGAWNTLSASETLTQHPRRALPWVRVSERRPGRDIPWTPRHDVLSSGRFERHFVADINDGDVLVLRFGTGSFGRRLAPGTKLRVQWRMGRGHLANVSADRLVRIAPAFQPFVAAVRNPLPAHGGLAAEDAERVRRDAPQAFRTQERCVTSEDYVTLARRVPGVRGAAVHLLWNGSWHVARVHVLPQEGHSPSPELLTRVRRYLVEHRLIGIEVEARPPDLIPLDIALNVGVRAGHATGTVRLALERELGSGTLEDGRPAFFHPSAFGFGQPVYLAPIIARAASVHGVAWVEATRFQRWSQDESSELESGRILMGATEVAQVEGRAGRPDLGLVTFHLNSPTGGGR